MTDDAFQASTRFGMGPAPKEIQTIKSDPRGWLEQQIQHAYIPQELAYLNDQARLATLYQRFAAGKQLQKQNQANADSAADVKALRQAYVEDSAVRLLAQVSSPQPFIERLVLFWSNHFTVSTAKGQLAGIVNTYEVQVIRPHVTGKFADLLIAVVQHPAMLMYLDNAKSIGPNSPQGQRQEKSINENLGREILELHTLGVGTGYTQDDVIALAKIITGWSVGGNQSDAAGQFAFHPGTHEPGAKTLLGKTYPEAGQQEGILALRDLARQPATAKHIATKLARHFVSDEPPPGIIDTLTKIYLQTDGDLSALYRALIRGQEAWQTPLAKFKNSYEYVVSALRLKEVKLKQQQVNRLFAALDIKPFSAPSPAGLPDTAVYWSSASTVLKRIEWARILSQDTTTLFDAIKVGEAMYGPLLGEKTRFILAGAASPQDANAFLLISPEFQRR